MLLSRKLSMAAVVVVGLGVFSCTGDKKPEEPVQPSAAQADTQSPPPAAQPEPPTQNFTSETVYFAFDDYSLNADAQDKLKKLAAHLQSSPKAIVQIEGHCDERGSVEYNLALGERRANAAKNFLTQLGIEAGRVNTISYGEEKPVTPGHDEAAWAKNRRDEFNVTNN